MSKVREAYLSMENAEQIVLIDNICQKCANLLLEKFSEEGNIEDFERDSFELKVEYLDELTEAFNVSSFCDVQGFDVGEAFDDTLFPLCAYNDATVMRILYPVLFYSLLVKNFQNKETISRRARRKSKSWGKTKNLLEVPSVDEQWEREKEDIPDKTRNARIELFKQITEYGRENSTSSNKTIGMFDEMTQLLFHGEVAAYLIGDSEFKMLEIVSRRGLLAKNILASQVSHTSPVDTILRLYLLQAIDGVVSNAALLSNGYEIADLPRSFLLTAFNEDQGIDPAEIMCKRDSDCREKQKKKVLLDSEIEITEDFDYLYAQLLALSFTMEDVKEMLDYFFDADGLSWYLKSGEYIQQYIEAIMEGFNQKRNIDERHFDLKKLFAPHRMNLFER